MCAIWVSFAAHSGTFICNCAQPVPCIPSYFLRKQSPTHPLGVPHSNQADWSEFTHFFFFRSRHKITRLVVVTSWCTQPGPNNAWFVEWILKPLFLNGVIKNMAVMEKMLEESDPQQVNYTIVRPCQLLEGRYMLNWRAQCKKGMCKFGLKMQFVLKFTFLWPSHWLPCEKHKVQGGLRISSDGKDRMGTKMKTKKIPRVSNKSQNSTWLEINPKQFNAESPSLKISRKDCTLFAKPCGPEARSLPPRHHHKSSDFFRIPKKIPTQFSNILESKIPNPEKNLRSSILRHLESGVLPPPGHKASELGRLA